MRIQDLLIKEIDQEGAITQRMLSRVPADKWGWKPHAKSMTMLQLTTHIAELAGWPAMAMNTTGIDFATMDYQPTPINTTDDLLNLHSRSLAEGRAAVENATDEQLWENWTMRSGDTIHGTFSKYEVVRVSIAQTIHHRAQLGVYLRLLDIPIPGSYGPSADEPNF